MNGYENSNLTEAIDALNDLADWINDTIDPSEESLEVISKAIDRVVDLQYALRKLSLDIRSSMLEDRAMYQEKERTKAYEQET